MVRPFKVISVSVYTDELAEIDECVAQLRARGLKAANRSALLRYAARFVDLDSVTAEDMREAHRNG